MLKAADRLEATIEYGDYRQLPVTAAQGLTYTTSVREIEPKGALETLIRHFTDSPEKKRERQAVADARGDQLRMAQMQSRDARDYSGHQRPDRNGLLSRRRSTREGRSADAWPRADRRAQQVG